MSRPRLLALLLAFITLLVYLPAGWHDFVNYDDPDYITDNPPVKNGLSWADMKWAFTTGHASNWHPLTWLSHQADCELFGLNPGAHHMVNVLIHAANVALVFLLLIGLTQRLWPSAMVAALFAWHPLHVESVAWISERKDVLSTFFGLLALLCYVRYGRNARPGNLWPVLVFFALALLAKPMLVTLPFIFLLLDFWPLGRLTGSSANASSINLKRALGLVLEKWPFFLLSIGSCVATVWAQNTGGAVVSLARVSFPYRIENAPLAVMDYIGKLFWPADLSVIYLLNPIALWQVALAVGALVAISVLAWRWRLTKPYFLMGWLWFLGMLVPVIGLVQVGSQAMADRYTYLPSVGFFLAVVLLVAEWLERLRTPKIIAAGLSALILAACIRVTELQLSYWRNSETLFQHAIAISPDNVVAWVNLGVTYDDDHRYPEALATYQQAEKLETGPYYQLHYNLGGILSRLGKPADALAEYRIAIRERPGDAPSHNAAGSELGVLGQFDQALAEFALAEQLNPHYAAPYLETARLYLQQGRDAEAVNALRAAIRVEPDNFETLAYTAHILAASEDPAVRDGKAALLLATQANHLCNHTQPLVFDVMGMACAELGDFTSAQACAQKAIDLATALQIPDIDVLRRRLDLYQKHQPWRESFRASSTTTTNTPAKP